MKHTRRLAFSHSGAFLAAAGGTRLIAIIDCLSLRLVHMLKVRHFLRCCSLPLLACRSDLL